MLDIGAPELLIVLVIVLLIYLATNCAIARLPGG